MKLVLALVPDTATRVSDCLRTTWMPLPDDWVRLAQGDDQLSLLGLGQHLHILFLAQAEEDGLIVYVPPEQSAALAPPPEPGA